MILQSKKWFMHLIDDNLEFVIIYIDIYLCGKEARPPDFLNLS